MSGVQIPLGPPFTNKSANLGGDNPVRGNGSLDFCTLASDVDGFVANIDPLNDRKQVASLGRNRLLRKRILHCRNEPGNFLMRYARVWCNFCSDLITFHLGPFTLLFGLLEPSAEFGIRRMNQIRGGPVAELFRSFDLVFCHKGETSWHRTPPRNSAQKQCG